MFRVNYEELQKVAHEYRERYINADPFPHVVIDGLFKDDALKGWSA